MRFKQQVTRHQWCILHAYFFFFFKLNIQYCNYIPLSSCRVVWHMFLSKPGFRTIRSGTTSYSVNPAMRQDTKRYWTHAQCCLISRSSQAETGQRLAKRWGWGRMGHSKTCIKGPLNYVSFKTGCLSRQGQETLLFIYVYSSRLHQSHDTLLHCCWIQK